jgi:hypothetical protein
VKKKSLAKQGKEPVSQKENQDCHYARIYDGFGVFGFNTVEKRGKKE